MWKNVLLGLAVFVASSVGGHVYQPRMHAVGGRWCGYAAAPWVASRFYLPGVRYLHPYAPRPLPSPLPGQAVRASTRQPSQAARPRLRRGAPAGMVQRQALRR